MVYPAQIVAFRKKYDLTQKELSELLGFGGITLSRYENGALQDEAHDQLLHFVMQPTNLLDLIKQKQDVFTDIKRKNILSRLDQEVTTATLIKEYFKNDKPSILSGNTPFDLEKVINLIKSITYSNPIVKSKLLKMLFYADFSYFKESGFSITGLNYAHLQYGPVPDQYDYLLASIQKIDSSIRVDVQPMGDYMGESFISDTPPTPGVFEEEILYFIRKVSNYFLRFTAKDIENFSHEEKGYKETIQGELISYQYAQDLQTLD
jgi:transcriptional regulator with XRE-family HTH domain